MHRIAVIGRRVSAAIITGLFLVGTAGVVAAQSGSSEEASEDIVRRTKELMSVTEQLRGLTFKHELPVELVSQEEMARIVQRLIDEEIDEEMDREYSAMYTLLGLLPRGTSIREEYSAMVEEQAAGLYDPAVDCFYVVDVDISQMIADVFPGMEALGSFAEGFFEGLGLDMSDTIIVHELTHALDDQYFDIEGTLEELMETDSDDAQLAYQSLLEGNATRVMNDFQYAQMGVDAQAAAGMAEMNLALAESLMDFSPFLERIMVTPYLQGEVFVRYILEREGQKGLDALFLDPPESMEQVLHPERFTPRRDDPSVVSDPDLSRALPGWELEATDTLGELLITLMFELRTGRGAWAAGIADGWDGDRMNTWRGPSGDLAFAWVTVWDDAKEAKEFFDAYCDLLELMHPGGSWERRDANAALYTGLGLAAIMEREGRDVAIVVGVPEASADGCLQAALDSPVVYR